MNHIEAKILEFVALLYPKPFAALDQFCAAHSQFMDETIRVFDREIQFYIAYLEFIADLKYKGLELLLPTGWWEPRSVRYRWLRPGVGACADLYRKSVVCNDFSLNDPERIIVVSGPNQGGKTTFARTFGQLHYLASLGCPVPGREARLFLFDQIFAHFERQEDIRNLRGKLEDDVARIHEILVTPHQTAS
jgi:DNA mismatch repair protein MutS